MFRGGDTRELQQSAEKMQAHMSNWMKWMGDLGEKGKLVGAQPLHSSGKTILGTRKVVSDGPFMEGKEMVGGYLICKADNYDEAVNISKGCPVLEFEDGNVEIREVSQM